MRNSQVETMQIARVKTADNQIQFVKQDGSRFKQLSGDLLLGFEENDIYYDADSLVFLPPVIPSKFIGIGKNFPEKEGDKTDLNLPNFFIKAPNAVVGHQAEVKLPGVFGATVIEGEFAVILKKGGRDIEKSDVQSHILGYTTVCDLSGRDFIHPDEPVPVAVKKSCDGFAPIGPFITLEDSIKDFEIETFVDGEMVQKGNSSAMFFGIAECISYISSLMTLEPFDIISMGTPEPKPKVNRGQNVEVRVNGLGTLAFSIH